MEDLADAGRGIQPYSQAVTRDHDQHDDGCKIGQHRQEL